MTGFDPDDSLTNKYAWLVEVLPPIDGEDDGEWGEHLHYVPGENGGTWDDWWDEGPFPKRRTPICGDERPVTLPGMFSRMGRPRCPECCAKLGITEGDGAGLNDDEARPVGVSLADWLRRKADGVEADAQRLADTEPVPRSESDDPVMFDPHEFAAMRFAHAEKLRAKADELDAAS